MRGIHMSISRDIVEAHGANAAIVYQQVYYAIAHGLTYGGTAQEGGWYRGTSEQMSSMTGLSPDQCRRAMAKLLEAGLMERHKFRRTQGDQTMSYRPLEPTVLPSGDFANSGSGDFATSASGDFARCTYSSEGKKLPSLNPSHGEGAGNDGPASLLEQPGPPATEATSGRLFETGTRNAGVSRRRKPSTSLADAEFESFWTRYPNIGGNKGSKSKAKRAFDKASGLDPMAAIDRQLLNYIDARDRFRQQWGEPAPLIHGSVWLNSRREDFNDRWSDEDLEFWSRGKPRAAETDPLAGLDFDQLIELGEAAAAAGAVPLEDMTAEQIRSLMTETERV